MGLQPLIYVQESLTDNEDIVDAAFYHWMYIAQAAFWMVFFFVIAMGILFIGAIYYHYPDLSPLRIGEAMDVLELNHYMQGFWRSNIFFRGVAFGLIIIGLLHFAGAMIVKASTEIAVTDRRVIYKRGLVARNVEDMRVENVESVDVRQGILGRLLHYGGLEIKGTGVGDIKLPRFVAHPIDFRKSIQMARDQRMEE